MSTRKHMSRREMRRRRRRNALIFKSVLLVLLIVVLALLIWFIAGGPGKKDKDQENGTVTGSSDPTVTTSSGGGTAVSDRDAKIAEAESMAVQYDYQGAIDLLKTVEGAAQDPDIITMIADYESEISNLVAIAPENVTHVFFHSLVVDPDRGFADPSDPATAGFCQWMTTVDEFNAMMNQMYERGYVLVDLHDMVEETTDENGVVHMTPKNILLPEGKTPFVLSLDDLSYYHSYDGRGTASKMILDEEGKPTCEYITAEGETLVGSYDCVPLLDDFLEAHPDFSYKGAKGTIALTGYNGILGYRTDSDYRTGQDLTADQQAWLDAHPDFDWDQECAEAKKVAEAMIADGWKFASHTWGHIRVGADCSLEHLQTDTERWLQDVAPLIGGTDTIIFAHGEDLAAWNENYADSPKFQYLKSKGFNIYCNVDSSKYFVQIEDGFLRMGRRNLDGYRLWEAVYGGNDRTSDLYDASTVFDPKRPTDAALYQL